MEKSIDQQFNEITAKIKKLKSRNERLETENETLRKSVFDYLQELENQKKISEKLTLGLQHGQMTQSLMMDKKTLQKEIDKYILMIDKCIAAVNAKM